MSENPVTRWSPFVITDIGLALRQKAIALGLQTAFAYVEVGEGIPSDPSQVPPMIELMQPAERGVIARTVSSGPTHRIEVRVDNSQLEVPIAMREIGVFAQLLPPANENDPANDDPDLPGFLAPTLYGYSYAISGYESIPAASDMHRIWSIGIDTQISRANAISIVYDGSAIYVTFDDFEAVQKMVEEALAIAEEVRQTQFESTPVTPTQPGLMTPEMLEKLEGIQSGATNYTHPSTHPASMIETDKDHRFVSDTLLTAVGNLVNNPNGLSLESLQEDIAYILWQLVLNGIIGMDGVDNVIVDNMDSATAVRLISGMYGNNRVYI